MGLLCPRVLHDGTHDTVYFECGPWIIIALHSGERGSSQGTEGHHNPIPCNQRNIFQHFQVKHTLKQETNWVSSCKESLKPPGALLSPPG